MSDTSTADLVSELDLLSNAAGPSNFRLFADAMPIMVWTALPDGRLDFVNRQVLGYMGRSYDGMIGEGWLGVLHPDDIAPTLEVWSRCLQTGERYLAEFRVLRHADQHYRWVDVHAEPLRDNQGKIQRWVGTCIDVHDTRLNREALESIEARHRLYTESTREGIWYWDVRTDRVEWNARTYEIMQTSREGFLGTRESFIDRVVPEDRHLIINALKAHIERGVPYRCEFRIPTSDGGVRYILAHGVADRDASGVAFRMAGGIVDLTEKKETEVMLSERLATIERQAEAIRQLSTPIIEVWDGVLTMPVLGAIDAQRAGRMMEILLQQVVERHCRYTIVDLTGVGEMDEATVGYVGRMLSALSLLGAKGIVVGITPEVAQMMVSFNLELSGVRMLRNLREALLFCMRALGEATPGRSGSRGARAQSSGRRL